MRTTLQRMLQRTRATPLATSAAVLLIVVFVALVSVVSGIVFTDAGTTGADSSDPLVFLRSQTTYRKLASTNPGLTNAYAYASLECDPGDLLLSGGYSGVDEGTLIVANGPDPAVSGEVWLVGWQNDGSADAIDLVVICADQSFPAHD